MMRESVRDLFGEQAPSVRVVRNLMTKALAGSRRIRIRKGRDISARRRRR